VQLFLFVLYRNARNRNARKSFVNQSDLLYLRVLRQHIRKDLAYVFFFFLFFLLPLLTGSLTDIIKLFNTY